MTIAYGMQPNMRCAVPSTTGISAPNSCAVNAVSEVNAETQLMAIQMPMETVATGIRTTEASVGISIPTTSMQKRIAVFAAADPEVPPFLLKEILTQKRVSTQTRTQKTAHMTDVSGTVPGRARAVTMMTLTSLQRRCGVVAVVEAPQIPVKCQEEPMTKIISLQS